MAFDFAAQHWDQISKLLEPATRDGYMPRLASAANDVAMIQKLDAFADAHIPAGARQEVRKTDASIRYTAKIKAERLTEANHWIAEHGG
jgi:aminopeptidase N